MTPRELLAAEADGLAYFTFLAEARKTLGDATPASRRKADVIQALKEAIDV